MSAQELSNETEEWLIGTRAAARSGERAGEEWPLAAIFVSRFANDSEARDFLEFLFPQRLTVLTLFICFRTISAELEYSGHVRESTPGCQQVF